MRINMKGALPPKKGAKPKAKEQKMKGGF